MDSLNIHFSECQEQFPNITDSPRFAEYLTFLYNEPKCTLTTKKQKETAVVSCSEE